MTVSEESQQIDVQEKQRRYFATAQEFVGVQFDKLLNNWC